MVNFTQLLRLIIIFIIASFLGWVYEYLLFHNYEYDKVSKKLFNINLPLLPIYGLGVLILILIGKGLNNYSIWMKTIVAFIVLNLMECLMGYVSYNFHGYQTWKYNDDYTLCRGYISLKTGLWWTILSFLFFFIYK